MQLTQPSSTSPSSVPLVSAQDVVRAACARIAPTWPLDRFIAVNPFWQLTHRSLPDVAAELRAWSGARLLMPRAWYRAQWRSGRFTDTHLERAAARLRVDLPLGRLKALLEAEAPELPQRARVMDVLDEGRDLRRELSWREVVVTSTSQFCAAYFDEGQSEFAPDRSGGLFASWRRFAAVDQSPGTLMRADQLQALARALPEERDVLFTRALAALEVPEHEREAYLTTLLLDLNGWASWCAYRRWTARQQGRDDDTLEGLLAIRLAWEWMLHDLGGPSAQRRWRVAMTAWPNIDAASRAAQAHEWIFQEAFELATRDGLIAPLAAAPRAPQSDAEAQVVFCIDVRSEVLRRHLETEAPRVQTLGFAGFFGLPIEYAAPGASRARPQLPGLLGPKLRVSEANPRPEELARLAEGRRGTDAWGDFKAGPVSTFTFVEAMGLRFGAELLRESLGLGAESREPHVAPRLVSTASGEALTLEARVALAEGITRGMSLTRGFAPLVALVGHGSRSRNNAHAAGLDCGACCGQTGEVNARAAAALLNDAEVRAGLSRKGVHIPDTTRFVAGLHETTTDEVTFFELEHLPASHAAPLATLQGQLARASERTREERARTLGVSQPKQGLFAAMRRRTRDWAQVRPEWGLANNAALVIAPRERTRGLDLAGRSFLHDYRHEQDPSGAVLELLMTAPLVVAHWINFQYYASTVDNARYGSGNKLLHNVVGGHLGVFEGNGGDLRIGLPMQSLHDGTRWMHEPVRLNVFIEAPREAIDLVLEKHAHVRALVANGWLHLFQLEAASPRIHALERGRWVSA